MVTVAIVAGAIASTIGFVRAAHNARIAHENAIVAQRQRNRATAKQSLRQVEIYNSSLLANANPTAGEKKDVTVRELLDGAAAQLDRGAQQGQPDVEAALAATGETYHSLSLWTQSEHQWTRTIDLENVVAGGGAESPNEAFALAGLGRVKLDTGNLDEADKLLKRALSIQREQLASNDWQIGDTVNNLGLLAYTRGDYKGRDAIPRSTQDLSADTGERAADCRRNDQSRDRAASAWR